MYFRNHTCFSNNTGAEHSTDFSLYTIFYSLFYASILIPKFKTRIFRRLQNVFPLYKQDISTTTQNNLYKFKWLIPNDRNLRLNAFITATELREHMATSPTLLSSKQSKQRVAGGTEALQNKTWHRHCWSRKHKNTNTRKHIQIDEWIIVFSPTLYQLQQLFSVDEIVIISL